MDCQTALEILEVVRPDSRDLRDEELASASAHIASCPECDASFRNRQELDRDIGRLMREVPVPTGARQRLLETLAAGDSVAPAGAVGGWEPPADRQETARSTSGSTPASAPRGRHIRIAWASAAGLLLAIVVWQVMARKKTPTISVAELQVSRHTLSAISRVLSHPGDVRDFDDNFPARLPSDWSVAGLSIRGTPKGLQPDSDDRRLLALFPFRLRSSRRRPVDGVLLVMPLARVTNRPPETSCAMAADGVRYVSGFATVTWTEGESVYVCFVAGGADALETLARSLEVSPV